MSEKFFERPILNSPYDYPGRHWQLDENGQPTQPVERRRRADFITPIPKPKKRKGPKQKDFVFDEGRGLSDENQKYDHTETINRVRQQVDAWRQIKDPAHWGVTPQTARLLQHWRHHKFTGDGHTSDTSRRSRPSAPIHHRLGSCSYQPVRCRSSSRP